MAEQKREVTAIADQKATASSDNTLGALEKSGMLLERAELAFSAAPTPTTPFRQTDTKTAPLLAAQQNAIRLNHTCPGNPCHETVCEKPKPLFRIPP
jgi:peptidyl-dipeptidase Dcp